MTAEFTLQGLDCANCAAKIEDSLRKTGGVLSANINLQTSKLSLEVADTDGLLEKVTQVVHLYEEDVLVTEAGNKQEEPDNTKKLILWLAVGGLAFVAGWIFEFGLVFFAFSYLLLGTKVLWRMLKNITKGRVFDENFLMGIATIGAIGIGEYAGAAAVMLFYQVGEFFQGLAVRKSKKDIAGLMDIRPDYANLQSGKKVSPETVNIGDIIIIKPGERVPLDGVVTEGESMLDTAALTGESVPRLVSPNEKILSGCINQSGVLTVEVTQTFGDSTASKIIDLVENAASKKAKIETFITKFAQFYTPVVVTLAALLAVVPPLFFGGDWADWIYRALILLIISCPCALVLSIPMGFFCGIGASSKRGVLVKGGNYLEALSLLEYVVFDKTGTLTKGVFEVTDIQPEGISKEQLLEAAACAEAFSSHPIAVSILKENNVNKASLSEYEEIAGHGVSVLANGKRILAGNEKLMRLNGITFTKSETMGTKVYVAIDGTFAGCIVISDEIKEDSRGLAAALQSMGVRKTVMLTGDSEKVAAAVAAELKIDEVYAGLLPQEKVEKVEQLCRQKSPGKALAFIGDGINDAPVLAMADVGIAMGGLGSDAAIEAADVVLMTDEPGKLVEAIKIARFTKRIVWQNIVFSLGIQVLFIVLGAAGVASIWEAIFADVGVALIAIFNSMRIGRYL